jgi:cell division transport system permease protein
MAPYALKVAVRSLLKEKWINLLSVMTIAAGLFIMSFSYLIFHNVDLAAKSLPDKFSMTVYLDSNIQKNNTERIMELFRKETTVLSVRYISRDEALKELKSALKNSDYVLEGIGDNPLPDSLEIKLIGDKVGTETAEQLAREALKIKGVADVDYGEKFLSSIIAVKKGFKILSIVFASVLSAGIIFVCYSTVKILFYRRVEEIETCKLLGATKTFIRTPFLIEGGVIGMSGGLLSLFGSFFLYYALLRLSISMPVFKAVIFPADIFLFLPIVGTFLGLAGAGIALGRLRY